MKERDCANCKHHTSDGCSSWDCEFEKAMTREEAIEILWRYDVNFEPHPPEEVMHAIDMAIEALSFAESAEAYKAWTGEEMGKTHGRLIDADFEEQHYASILLNPSPDVTAKDKEDARIILGALKMAKTVSADRPHGKWIDGKWCSICGCGIPTDVWGGGLSEEEAHYCVNCGAKMGGDNE